jgi:hypothetical protein
LISFYLNNQNYTEVINDSITWTSPWSWNYFNQTQVEWGIYLLGAIYLNVFDILGTHLIKVGKLPDEQLRLDPDVSNDPKIAMVECC